MAKKKVSRFKSPSSSRRHLKIQVEGGWGVGKTHFALTFPKPAVIDPEHGTDLFMGRTYKGPDGKEIPFDFQCSYNRSIYDAIEDVESLRENPGDRETLIIDPITLFWEQAQDSHLARIEEQIAAGQGRRKDSGIQFGDWKDIKRPYKRLLNRLLGLPMHVVLLARIKDDFKVDGGNIEKIGESMDAEKSTPYIADIVLRLERRGSDKGPTRIARVRKDRSGLFDGRVIENPSFHTFAPLMERLSAFEGDVPDVEDEEEASEKDVAHIEKAEETKKANALKRRIDKNKKAFADLGNAEIYTTILERNEALPLSEQDSSKLQLVLDELANEYNTLKAAKETK